MGTRREEEEVGVGTVVLRGHRSCAVLLVVQALLPFSQVLFRTFICQLTPPKSRTEMMRSAQRGAFSSPVTVGHNSPGRVVFP